MNCMNFKFIPFIVIFVILFLWSVYAQELKLAFIFLLVSACLAIFYIEEQRLKSCQEKCKT